MKQAVSGRSVITANSLGYMMFVRKLLLFLQAEIKKQ